MTSNAWHEGVKHTSREQSLSSQQNIHRQGGEPGFNSDFDFDSAWQALRNLTEGSLANPTSQESTQLTNSDLQVGGNNKPTAFEPHKNENTTYLKPEIKKAVSFSPSMEAQNKLNPGPSFQQISPQSPLPQPKSSWRQKHLSGMMLCGVYVAMGYLGAGLIDRINEKDLWTAASQALKEQLLLSLQESEKTPEFNVSSESLESALDEPNISVSLPYKVNVKSALIRSEPHNKAKIVGSLNYETIVLGDLVGKDEQWIKVSEGQYMSQALVTPIAKVSPEKTSTPVAEKIIVPSKTFWTVDSKLAVYNAQDTSSPVLKYLPYAAKLEGQIIPGETWFKLDSGGFVEYATLSETKPFYTKPGRAALAEVFVQKAPLMNAPRASASMTGIFFKSKQVTVHRVVDGWAEISKGQYIKASQLMHIQPKQNLSKHQSKE